MKQQRWNDEFATGRWDFIENTPQDMIYGYLVKYCNCGSILDLGSGSGNTGCELDRTAYKSYTGIDISDVAIEKAKSRSDKSGRGDVNRYFQSDISSYEPDQKFNIILFRESIYYIPRGRIKDTLIRYSQFLAEDGVFIIKWCDGRESEEFLNLIGIDLEILEKHSAGPDDPFLVVLRPRQMSVSRVSKPLQK
jgi:SAM-dependent methyltransferase